MSRPIRDRNRRPTHPGEVLRLDVLPAIGITQDQFAQRLGVSRLTVSQLLNGHRSLTAATAVRLERETGVRAEQWLGMQQAVDLWEARREASAVAATVAPGLAAMWTGARIEAGAAIERARAKALFTTEQVVAAPRSAVRNDNEGSML